MNGGTFLAFLLTAVMVAVVIIHPEPATTTVPGVPMAPKPPVVVPAQFAPGTASSNGAKPVAQLAMAPATPPAAPSTSRSTANVADGHDLKTHGIGCAVAGTAGTGLAFAAGPADVAALIAGALLIPVSPIMIGAALGTVFVTGCAVGAVVSPMLSD